MYLDYFKRQGKILLGYTVWLNPDLLAKFLSMYCKVFHVVVTTVSFINIHDYVIDLFLKRIFQFQVKKQETLESLLDLN